ncbi:MAG TPA: cupin domain-containing protein [Candidatus Gracilibacteria bacterium]|nr:cupin domain-containing protein [Candidatus Gracilibacteria bacterium]
MPAEQTTLQRVPKPWGEEIWWANQPEYAGKILVILKGKRLSLQYHRQKKESQYVLKGKIKLHVGEKADSLKEITLGPGEKYDIHPNTIHRLEALEDSEVLEVSTAQLDDVVRIEDDYKRPAEGNDFELDRRLAGINTPAVDSAKAAALDTPTE